MTQRAVESMTSGGFKAVGLTRSEGARGAAFLLLILVAAFSRQLFTGGMLACSDVLPWTSPWSASAENPSSPRNPNIGETLFQITPWRDLARRELRSGRMPLWNPYSFAGAPLLANYQSAPLDPLCLADLVLEPPRGRLFSTILRLWISGFFALLLLRTVGVSPFSAFLGASAWMLNVWMSAWILWPLGPAAAFLPWILFYTLRLARGHGSGSVAGLAAGVALLHLSGHPETAYFVLVFASLVALFLGLARERAVPGARRGPVSLLFLFGCGTVLGAVLAAVQIVPFLEYLRVSAAFHFRGEHVPDEDPSVSFLYRLPSLLLPKIFGTHHDQSYAGPGSFNAMMGYAGAIPLVLCPLALADRRRRPLAAFLLVLGGILALAAFRTPYFEDIVRVLPGFGLAATSRLVLFWIAGCVIAGALGWQVLEEGWLVERRRPPLLLFASATIVGVTMIVCVVLLREVMASEEGAREAWRQGVLGVSFALVVPALALLRSLVAVPLPIVRSAVLVAILLDLGRVVLPGLPSTRADEYFPPLAAVERLREMDPGVYRVGPVGRSIFPGNTCLEYGLMDVRGNDALTVLEYERLFRRVDERGALDRRINPRQKEAVRRYLETGDESHLDGFDNPFFKVRMRGRVRKALAAGENPVDLLTGGDRAGSRILLLNDVSSPILDFLNVKYLLVGMESRPEKVPGLEPPRWIHLFTEGLQVYENTLVVPRAHLVTRVVEAATLDEALELLARGEIPAQEAAVVVGRSPLGQGGEAAFAGEVLELHHSAHEVRIRARVDAERCLLVLADTFYPGWKAQIDGEEAEILRTNVVLRGVVLERGEHEVLFRYRPVSFAVGASMSGLGLAVLGVLLGFSGVRRRRR
jgi:hypothetical protein